MEYLIVAIVILMVLPVISVISVINFLETIISVLLVHPEGLKIRLDIVSPVAE